MVNIREWSVHFTLLGGSVSFFGEGDSSKARTQHTIVFYFCRGGVIPILFVRRMYDIFSYLGWCYSKIGVCGGGGGDYLGEANVRYVILF